MNRSSQFVKKSGCIFHYDDFMCCMYQMDQLCLITHLRNSHCVIQRVVLHITDMAVANTYLLYKKLVQSKIAARFGSDRMLFRHCWEAKIDHRPQPSSTTWIPTYPDSVDSTNLDVIPATAAIAGPCWKCAVRYKHGKSTEMH